MVIVVARGSSEATLALKRSEAENLRARFVSCNEGLAMARGLRDVAVRDPVTRNSSDLSPQLRDVLGNIQLGHLTAPEIDGAGAADVRGLRQERELDGIAAEARNARANFHKAL